MFFGWMAGTNDEAIDFSVWSALRTDIKTPSAKVFSLRVSRISGYQQDPATSEFDLPSGQEIAKNYLTILIVTDPTHVRVLFPIKHCATDNPST